MQLEPHNYTVKQVTGIENEALDALSSNSPERLEVEEGIAVKQPNRNTNRTGNPTKDTTNNWSHNRKYSRRGTHITREKNKEWQTNRLTNTKG